MTLKIETLRTFLTVARCGNIRDAADTLGRTPSAVSMTLKQLETYLGEPLFETDRKNRLTALGAFTLEQAERQLQQFDNTIAAIEGYARATHGHVRIATVPSVAALIIPRFLSKSINDFSGVSIELRDMDSNSVLAELLRDRVDIGIASAGEYRPGLHCQLLWADAFGVLCAPSHPLAQENGPVALSALKGHRLIANNLSAQIKNSSAQEMHVSAQLSARNLTSIIGMVSANIGVTILPEMAARTMNPMDLVFRPLSDEIAKRHIHLLRKADVSQSPAARRIEARMLATVRRMASTFAA